MHLVIFDIDGTLIHSHQDEADCFINAVSDVTGISQITKELTHYQHVTDTGIANECIYKHFKRPATSQETSKIEKRFLELFQAKIAHTPFTLISGVQTLFENLKKLENTFFAIATGSYYQSARIKLQPISSFLRLPIGSANDSPERTKIMTTALHKSKEHYQQKNFKSITYIGDGPWDIRAVNELGWNFIGIASHYSAATLQAWGAKWVVSDYLKPEPFLHYLHQSQSFHGN